MTNTSGTKLVVGDADVLIGLLLKDDSNYNLATILSRKINKHKVKLIFPDTAIAEAITALLRKHSNPELAGYLKDLYLKGEFLVEYVNEDIMAGAAELFNPKSSKKNTFFDAIVAATAKKLNADAIFSFDNWYTKMGFKLVKDLI